MTNFKIMRKLASIQKIKNIESIKNADSIEKASILGWNVVVKKGDFKPEELCVYMEIDSLLPKRPEFLFLEPNNMRIKTVRLRGQVSQGICFPTSILNGYVDTKSIKEGDDVTEALGILKYEPPIPSCLSEDVKGTFPSLIPKTDETRIQVLEHIIKKYKGTKCFYTEKIDGTSVTYYLNNGEFGVCSRNYDLKESGSNALWKIAKNLKLKERMLTLGRNIAFQGEVYGEGIQKNKYNIKGQTVKFFNAFDIKKHSYFGLHEFIKIMDRYKLEHVPILNKDFDLIDNIEELVALSTIKSTINPDKWAEGIVIRPIDEVIDPDIGRLSFKAINPEFLLKNNE